MSGMFFFIVFKYFHSGIMLEYRKKNRKFGLKDKRKGCTALFRRTSTKTSFYNVDPFATKLILRTNLLSLHILSFRRFQMLKDSF